MTTNFEYYKVFYYVAKYNNFTLAANVLLTSQPSVTRSIKSLEHNLGCRLFIRSKRGVTLTPEGELLYRHIAPACESIYKGEEALGSALSLQKGTVYIGATETTIHGLLLEKLERFHGKYPGVHIKILNDSTPPIIADLKSGKIDLAIVTTPIEEDKKHLQITKIKAFQDILIAGPNFANLQDKQLKLHELEKYPLVCLSNATMTYRFYSDFYAKYGVHLNPDIELATADLLLPIIAKNLGIGFAPEDLVSAAVEQGVVFKLNLVEKIPERHICIVRNVQNPLSIAARQLIRILKSE